MRGACRCLFSIAGSHVQCWRGLPETTPYAEYEYDVDHSCTKGAGCTSRKQRQAIVSRLSLLWRVGYPLLLPIAGAPSGQPHASSATLRVTITALEPKKLMTL